MTKFEELFKKHPAPWKVIGTHTVADCHGAKVVDLSRAHLTIDPLVQLLNDCAPPPPFVQGFYPAAYTKGPFPQRYVVNLTSQEGYDAYVKTGWKIGARLEVEFPQ